jgi:GDP/UDP-N,N'-diacetylbacillosamine 2-epimerase (hydrolysing)
MRKICVFTGTRAEFGLLHLVMRGIQDSPDLTLQIVATGMHLSPEFGMTIQEIRSAGFEPNETIEMLLSGDTPTAVCKSMGLGLISYGEAFERLRPDILVVLGDRFEAFCAAAAACVFRIPVAHIHGGELTRGAMDEAFRHAITKMSHLHFTSTEEYRKRVIQLGENPDYVFNVGALGVEVIRKLRLLMRQKLKDEIGFEITSPCILVTFHPVTLEKDSAEEQFQGLLDALNELPALRIVFTKANADTEGRVINAMIDDFVRKKGDAAISFASMGQFRYLSTMQYVDAVVGNSSSGIIEAPCFAVPTVNIGDRQWGRVQSASIINCTPDKGSVLKALQKAFFSDFKKNLAGMANLYEKENTAITIMDIIRKCDLSGIIKKEFFNLQWH